jgi:protein-disulfide isomerase
MKKFWRDIGLYSGAFVAGLAIVVVGPIVRERLVGAGPSQLATRRIDAWQSIVSAGRLIGDHAKPVQVIEFADFQCPGCREIHRVLDSVGVVSGKHVTFAYLYFPLKYHQYGRSAAIAAECAAEQDRFEAYHNILFAHQDSLGLVNWMTFARRAGIPDLPTFQKCLGDSSAAVRVSEDMAIGNRIGVEGTPSFVIDGFLYPFQTPTDVLVQAIAKAAK